MGIMNCISICKAEVGNKTYANFSFLIDTYLNCDSKKQIF
jgi:hypothetical protein